MNKQEQCFVLDETDASGVGFSYDGVHAHGTHVKKQSERGSFAWTASSTRWLIIIALVVR